MTIVWGGLSLRIFVIASDSENVIFKMEWSNVFLSQSVLVFILYKRQGLYSSESLNPVNTFKSYNQYII